MALIGSQYGRAAPPSGSTPSLRPAVANGVHVDDVLEILDIGQDEVFLVRACGL